VAWLLDRLREAGAHEQAAALLAREPAAHAALDDSYGVARLLASLREAGAHEQAAALLAREPADMFEFFLEQNGPADQFCFGRESDGTPAAPWGWEDLDLFMACSPVTGTDGTGAALSRGRPCGTASQTTMPLRSHDRLSLARPVSAGRLGELSTVDRRHRNLNTDNLLPGTSRPTLRARDDGQLPRKLQLDRTPSLGALGEDAAIGAENEEMT
jgi:hypothetical protein